MIINENTLFSINNYKHLKDNTVTRNPRLSDFELSGIFTV